MKLSEWVNVYHSQASTTMTFWNVYIIVALGIIGYLDQSENTLNMTRKIYLAIAWGLFSIANFIPLYNSQTALIKIHNHLDNLKDIFSVVPIEGVMGCHVIFDFIIIIVILRWNRVLPSS